MIKILILSLLTISFFSNAQQVDAGNGHSLILDKDGKLYTIGRNDFGQLGVGSNENSARPIYLSNLPKIIEMSRGYDHSLAIDKDGFVWAWGRNNYGQLGTSLPLDYDTPQKLAGHRFIAIEGGHWHSVGLKSDGTVWSWGHNFYGELGVGDREHSSSPRTVVNKNGEPITGIVKIVSVGYHNLALHKDGFLYSWGGNEAGELGHFKHKIQHFAERIEGIESIKSIAVGWHHSVALNYQGEVFVWGSKPSTQHKETIGSKYEEITKLTGLPPIEKVACGSWHSLAVDAKGNVWGWGRNHFGMLGTGNDLSSENPIKITSLQDICEIGGGCFQSIAVDKKGEIWTMGDNPSGQLGQGDFNRLYAPKKIDLASASVFAGTNLDASSNQNGKLSGAELMRYIKYILLGASLFLNLYFLFRIFKSRRVRTTAS